MIGPGNVEDFNDFARFVLWSDEKLKNKNFCLRLFPNHCLEDVNQIYEQYKNNFLGKFIHFVMEKKEIKNEILSKLIYEYDATFRCLVNFNWFDIFKYIMGKNSYPENHHIREYLREKITKQRSILNNAFYIYQSNG